MKEIIISKKIVKLKDKIGKRNYICDLRILSHNSAAIFFIVTIKCM